MSAYVRIHTYRRSAVLVLPRPVRSGLPLLSSGSYNELVEGDGIMTTTTSWISGNPDRCGRPPLGPSGSDISIGVTHHSPITTHSGRACYEAACWNLLDRRASCGAANCTRGRG